MAMAQISSRKETVGDTPVIPERACQRKVLHLKRKEEEEATRDGRMGLFQMMMDNLIEWI